MKNFLKHFFILICITLILTLPYFVFAQNEVMSGLTTVAEDSGFSKKTTKYSMAEYLGNIVNMIISLLGIIFTALILYAGYCWMTAAGDQSKLETAKNTLRRSIIGLIILTGSYAIWAFIWKATEGLLKK
jgi:cytochrome bd-type quinol oxidase subunit 2